MKYRDVTAARFIDRPNRFVAHAEIGGAAETVHVKNTGRCKELLLPGVPVILAKADNPSRKTKYDLIAVKKKGLGWVNIDSQAPNAAVREWLERQRFDRIRPEYVYGDSRIDFYMEKGKRKFLLEIKGCTLEIGGVGYFPDAPTERGVKHIRERFGPREVELRLDANGGFEPDQALYRLELLSQYAIHSIEQPIKARQWALMAELCREAPLPIALDEELIGVNDPEQKRQLLRIVKPAYIVLKPSLHGGMAGCREWVSIAREEGVGSWLTSALESNIGLYAIAQLCLELYGPNITMPQGLGTGQLFTDNIPMPMMRMENCELMIEN